MNTEAATSSTTRLVRVMIADDDPQVRGALIDLIGDDETLEFVGAGSDAATAVAIALEHRPDVAVLDVRMPGGGPAAAQGILLASPTTAVIALSSYGDRHTVDAMRAAGATRFLVKGAPESDLLASIAEVVSAR